MLNRSKEGFTLIETVTSLGVLLMFFTAITVIFQLSTNLVGEARVRMIAASLASERLEQVRNLSIEEVGTVGGIPSGVLPQTASVELNGQTFNVATTVVYIDDPFDGQAPTDLLPYDYKRVKVSVSWQGAFASINPVVMFTDVVPNGIETVEGGGTLMISVNNSSGEAVANAQVSIVNNEVTPNIDLVINTNNQGKVLLPGAPACNNCYQIQVTKPGYTNDRTYSSSEVANPLKPHYSVLEADLTSTTFAIDPISTITFVTTGSRANNFPPFTGVQFLLEGTKIIGYDTLDQPVLKYSKQLVSAAGGRVTVTNLDSDTYSVTIPNPSSVDLSGSYPVSPFSLSPGSNVTFTLATEASTANNLLVIGTTASGQLIATASATIKAGVYIATKSAGLATNPDRGQVLFGNLLPRSYEVIVTHPDYKKATASAAVSQDSRLKIYMEPL